MAMLTFNGYEIPDPSEMEITIQDVSSNDSGRSGRTALMNKFVIARKRSIHLGWTNISQYDARLILVYMRASSNPTYVTVTYDGDPEETGTQTRTFYYGDIRAPFQQCWVAGRKRYSKLTLDLIER